VVKRRLRPAIVALAAGSLLCAALATAGPAERGSGGGGQIVYVDDNRVVAESPAGGPRRVLARKDFGFILGGVTVNRSGRRIVYEQSGILGGGPGPGELFTKFEMVRRGDPDGRFIRRFRTFVQGFDISDDGRRITLAKGAGRTSDNVEIFVMRTNGSRLHKVTNCPGECTDPSFSPDGRRIVFIRGDHVAVMSARGGPARALTGGRGTEMMPTFSPNGNRIAYVSSQGGNLFHIWIMRANGSREERLTSGRGGQEFNPDFAPTGRALVYENDRFIGGRGGIFTIRPDGSRRRKVQGSNSTLDPDWTRKLR
jgi:dipeptidyl aminopeptidase/acylaminoacyl peptidase